MSSAIFYVKTSSITLFCVIYKLLYLIGLQHILVIFVDGLICLSRLEKKKDNIDSIVFFPSVIIP